MADKLTFNMVPTIEGPELYSFADHKITIQEGSGFNPNGPQHKLADGVRYGIAIQEARTAGDYELADKRAAWARGHLYDVGTGPGYTVISRGKNMVETDGIIYDVA